MALIFDSRAAKTNSVRMSSKVIEEIALLELHVVKAVQENKLSVEITNSSEIEINGVTVTGTQMTQDLDYYNVWQNTVQDELKQAEMQAIINYFSNQLRYSITRFDSATFMAWRIGW